MGTDAFYGIQRDGKLFGGVERKDGYPGGDNATWFLRTGTPVHESHDSVRSKTWASYAYVKNEDTNEFEVYLYAESGPLLLGTFPLDSVPEDWSDKLVYPEE